MTHSNPRPIRIGNTAFYRYTVCTSTVYAATVNIHIYLVFRLVNLSIRVSISVSSWALAE
jgi:hypothetical protein